MKRWILCGLIVGILGYPLVAQDGDASNTDDTFLLEEILSQTNTRLQWDPYRRQGALVRGSRLLTFSL
ncbi:MAG: hypothetical protein ACOCYB_05270, partial [Alkalispirochaeta sp.]